MTTSASTRKDVIERLQNVEAEIRHLGVRRLALFGSTLRDAAQTGQRRPLLVE